MSSQPFISVAVLALFRPLFFHIYLSLDDSSYPQLSPPYTGDDHKCPLTQATSLDEQKDKKDLYNFRSPELHPIHLNTARHKHFHPYPEAG